MKNVPLRAARFRAGLTAKELAKEVGVTRVTISRWENGHSSPTVDQLRLAATALGCLVSDLIDDEGVAA